MSGKRLEIVNPADAPEVHVPEGKRKADRVTTVYAWGSTRKGVTGIPVPRGVKPEPRGPAVVEKLKGTSDGPPGRSAWALGAGAMGAHEETAARQRAPQRPWMFTDMDHVCGCPCLRMVLPFFPAVRPRGRNDCCLW